jgi:ABC-type transporter Mla MlaB component
VIDGIVSADGTRLILSGSLNFDTTSILVKQLVDLPLLSVKTVDLQKLERVDTAGVACLVWLATKKIKHSPLEMDYCSDKLAKLLEVTAVRSFFRIKS